MTVKFWVGRGFIITDEMPRIDCPNKYNGIGNITIKNCDCGFWTGEVWLGGKTFTFSFANLKKVDTRSNLWETDEKWSNVWEHNSEPFTYHYWNDVASKIRGLFI